MAERPLADIYFLPNDTSDKKEAAPGTIIEALVITTAGTVDTPDS